MDEVEDVSEIGNLVEDVEEAGDFYHVECADFTFAHVVEAVSDHESDEAPKRPRVKTTVDKKAKGGKKKKEKPFKRGRYMLELEASV